jgi:hypothetical protein
LLEKKNNTVKDYGIKNFKTQDHVCCFVYPGFKKEAYRIGKESAFCIRD